MIGWVGSWNKDRWQWRRSSWIIVALCILSGPGLLSGTAHAAVQAFAKQGAKLFAGSAGGTSIGSIMPGTPLNTAGSQASGHRLKVSITGWFAEGYSQTVYKAPDLHIVMITLAGKPSGNLKILGKKQDSYGTTWVHATITGWTPTSRVTRDVGTVWAAAKKIYDARCSSCHALHAPDQFTANQWPGVLKTMARNASLSESQRVLVTQYLQAHAQKP